MLPQTYYNNSKVLSANLCTSQSYELTVTLKAVVPMVKSRVMRKRRMKVMAVPPMLSSSASMALSGSNTIHGSDIK